MIAGAEVSAAGAGVGAGTARDATDGESKGKRRKRNPSNRRKRKGSGVARKYFIETFGCQMNFHDSERIAGLLERDGYEPPVGRTPRRCRRHQHLQCSRARRREALHAARRDPRSDSVTTRRRAARRRDGMRRAAGRRPLLRTRTVHRRRRRHAEPEAASARSSHEARQSRRHASSTSIRTTTSRFRWASRARPIRCARGSRSSKAATSSARSASCRTRAATSGCGRSRTSSPRCARRREPGSVEVQLLGQIVNHYQAPDDPSCDFAGAARARAARLPASTASASPARIRATSRTG